MRAYERLLDYVRVYTTSDPESGTHPSAAREFDLAHKLVEELKTLGVEDARVDEHCYVYGSLPATPGCEEKPALGLIAHMDTAPDAGGENVNPILHENYDGGDVVLPATGKVMKVSAFPFLASMKGETLITTDGTTLLGADDKAGVAEIMTAVETGSSLDREMIANFPAMLPGLAFQTYIRKNIDVKKAPLALQPLCFFSPRCTATGDYAALCDEMLARMEG